MAWILIDAESWIQIFTDATYRRWFAFQASFFELMDEDELLDLVLFYLVFFRKWNFTNNS